MTNRVGQTYCTRLDVGHRQNYLTHRSPSGPRQNLQTPFSESGGVRSDFIVVR